MSTGIRLLFCFISIYTGPAFSQTHNGRYYPEIGRSVDCSGEVDYLGYVQAEEHSVWEHRLYGTMARVFACGPNAPLSRSFSQRISEINNFGGIGTDWKERVEVFLEFSQIKDPVLQRSFAGLFMTLERALEKKVADNSSPKFPKLDQIIDRLATNIRNVQNEDDKKIFEKVFYSGKKDAVFEGFLGAENWAYLKLLLNERPTPATGIGKGDNAGSSAKSQTAGAQTDKKEPHKNRPDPDQAKKETAAAAPKTAEMCKEELIEDLKAIAKKVSYALSDQAIAELNKLPERRLGMLKRLSWILMKDLTTQNELRWLLSVAPILNQTTEVRMLDSDGNGTAEPTQIRPFAGILEAAIDEYSKKYDTDYFNHQVNYEGYLPAEKLTFLPKALDETSLEEGVSPGELSLREKFESALRRSAPNLAKKMGGSFSQGEAKEMIEGVVETLFSSGQLIKTDPSLALPMAEALLQSEMIQHANGNQGKIKAYTPNAHHRRISDLVQTDPIEGAIENAKRLRLSVRSLESDLAQHIVKIGHMPDPEKADENPQFWAVAMAHSEVLQQDMVQKGQIAVDDNGELTEDSKNKLLEAGAQAKVRIIVDAARRALSIGDIKRAQHILNSVFSEEDAKNTFHALKSQTDEAYAVKHFLSRQSPDSIPRIHLDSSEEFQRAEATMRDQMRQTQYEVNDAVRAIIRKTRPEIEQAAAAQAAQAADCKPCKTVLQSVELEPNGDLVPDPPKPPSPVEKGYDTIEEVRLQGDNTVMMALGKYLTDLDTLRTLEAEKRDAALRALAVQFINANPKDGSDAEKFQRLEATINTMRRFLEHRERAKSLARAFVIPGKIPSGSPTFPQLYEVPGGTPREADRKDCAHRFANSNFIIDSAHWGDPKTAANDLQTRIQNEESKARTHQAETAVLIKDLTKRFGLVLEDGGRRVAWERMSPWRFTPEDWKDLAQLQKQLTGEDLIQLRDLALKTEHERNLEKDIADEEVGGNGGNGSANIFQYKNSLLAVRVKTDDNGKPRYELLDFEYLRARMANEKRKLDSLIQHTNPRLIESRTSFWQNYWDHMFNSDTAKYTGAWISYTGQWAAQAQRPFFAPRPTKPVLPPTKDTKLDKAADDTYNHIVSSVNEFHDEFGNLVVEGRNARQWVDQWGQQLFGQNVREAELLKQARKDIESVPWRVAELASYFVGGEVLSITGRALIKGGQWVRWATTAARASESAVEVARTGAVLTRAAKGLKEADKIQKFARRAAKYAAEARKYSKEADKLQNAANEALKKGNMDAYTRYAQQAIEASTKSVKASRDAAAATHKAAKIASSIDKTQQILELTQGLARAKEKMDHLYQLVSASKWEGYTARLANSMAKAPMVVKNAVKRGVQLEALAQTSEFVKEYYRLNDGANYWSDTSYSIKQKSKDDPSKEEQLKEGTWRQMLASGKIKNLPLDIDKTRDGIPDREQGLGGPEIRLSTVVNGAAGKTRMFMLSPLYQNALSKIPGLNKIFRDIAEPSKNQEGLRRLGQWIAHYNSPKQWGGMTASAFTTAVIEEEKRKEISDAIEEGRRTGDWARLRALGKVMGLQAAFTGFMANDIDRGLAKLARNWLPVPSLAKELAAGAAAYAPNATMSFAQPYAYELAGISGSDKLREDEAWYMRGWRSMQANAGADAFASNMAMKGTNPANLPASRPVDPPAKMDNKK